MKAYKALSTKYKALNCNGMRNHLTKVLSLKPAADKDWSAGQMGPQWTVLWLKSASNHLVGKQQISRITSLSPMFLPG